MRLTPSRPGATGPGPSVAPRTAWSADDLPLNPPTPWAAVKPPQRLFRTLLLVLLLGRSAAQSQAQLPDQPPPRPVELGGPTSTPKSPATNPPAPAAPAPHASATNPAPSLRTGTFSDANLYFASTNLLQSDEAQALAKARADELSEFKRRVETAQRQRAAKLFDEATVNNVAILNSTAPDDMKRTALLELALTAQEQGNLSRALQILSQFLSRWPQDANAPEILLRQGLIYRQLGIHSMAMGKFYATMTTALVLKNDHFDFYRKLVLQAQAEIAETLALQNKHKDAGEAFARLLKEDSPALNHPRVHYRYLQSLAAQNKHAEAVGQAQDYLTHHADAPEAAEVRFLLATSLKKLGRNSEALEQVLRLLQSQQGLAKERPEALAYWQQRTGNEIANQLYQEGDFLRALDIYQSLLLLNPAPAWQCPVLYQIGLAYERLEQPTKAAEAYSTLLAHQSALGTNAPASLQTLLEMARWRQDFLRWHVKTELAHREVRPTVPPESAPAPEPSPAKP